MRCGILCEANHKSATYKLSSTRSVRAATTCYARPYPRAIRTASNGIKTNRRISNLMILILTAFHHNSTKIRITIYRDTNSLSCFVKLRLSCTRMLNVLQTRLLSHCLRVHSLNLESSLLFKKKDLNFGQPKLKKY